MGRGRVAFTSRLGRVKAIRRDDILKARKTHWMTALGATPVERLT